MCCPARSSGPPAQPTKASEWWSGRRPGMAPSHPSASLASKPRSVRRLTSPRMAELPNSRASEPWCGRSSRSWIWSRRPCAPSASPSDVGARPCWMTPSSAASSCSFRLLREWSVPDGDAAPRDFRAGPGRSSSGEHLFRGDLPGPSAPPPRSRHRRVGARPSTRAELPRPGLARPRRQPRRSPSCDRS